MLNHLSTERMNGMKTRMMFALVLGLAITMACPFPAAAEKVKKIDNFIVFLDQSGSMAENYPPTDQKKIDLAIKTISRLDRALPELGYSGGLFMFAPYEEVMSPRPYRNGALQAAVSNIKTDFEVFGRPTPMGDGLKDLDPVIGHLSGKTALIILTDGDSNAGSAPVPQAQALYSKYGPNLCIHVISFADSPKGKKIIGEIRALSNCSVAADGNSLATDAAMDQYVADVFYREVATAQAIPMDSDGDGVSDDKDQCPDTPKGVAVDARGCELKLTLHINFAFDSAEIKPEFKSDLDKAATFVRANKDIPYILIAGYTDNQGPADYNMSLSKRRADAVRQALIDDYGVDPDKLKTRGYGETQPVADNSTKEGRYLNRRVEILCCTVLPQ